MISPAQCRAARALLHLQQRDFADRAGVARRTLADFENEVRRPFDRTLRDIRTALEDHGVIFLDADDDAGPGVRLRTDPGSG